MDTARNGWQTTSKHPLINSEEGMAFWPSWSAILFPTAATLTKIGHGIVLALHLVLENNPIPGLQLSWTPGPGPGKLHLPVLYLVGSFFRRNPVSAVGVQYKRWSNAAGPTGAVNVVAEATVYPGDRLGEGNARQ